MTAERLSVSGLGGVPETLTIPLTARATARIHFPSLGFSDPVAADILERLDADPNRFLDDRMSLRGCIVRAQWFDAVAARFLARNPGGLCVNLGAGLDARWSRMGFSRHTAAHWVDADLPEVMELRRQLVPQTDRVATIEADLNETGWMENLPWPPGRSALFMAEGVTMYLTQDTMEQFLRALGAAADRRGADISLAFDYVSPFVARTSRLHRSVRRTGARFTWTLRRPRDLQRIDSGLTLAEHADIALMSGPGSAIRGIAHRMLTFGRRLYACARFERRPQGRGEGAVPPSSGPGAGR